MLTMARRFGGSAQHSFDQIGNMYPRLNFTSLSCRSWDSPQAERQVALEEQTVALFDPTMHLVSLKKETKTGRLFKFGPLQLFYGATPTFEAKQASRNAFLELS